MKIAYFVRNFPVLSETFVLNQITGLIDLGHSVDIYAMAPKPDQKVHPDVEKYRLLDRTTYIDFPPSRMARAVRALGLLARKAYKNPKLYLNAINPMGNMKRVASLKPLLMLGYFDKPYDILHCHFGPIGNMGVWLKCINAPIRKHVTTFHAADLTVFFNNNDTAAYSELFQQGDLMLPISHRWKNTLAELGCDPHKIQVHRMGVDCNRFKFKKRMPPEQGKVKLISVSRLTEKKGIAYSIKAMQKLIQTFENVEYQIVGDGALLEELSDLINQLNLTHVVKMLGPKSQIEVRNLLDESHILIAPSVTAKDGDQEGIPVAIMEAMAMGMPVISTQHSGIPELIENEVSGLLVPERDADALARSISFLLKNPDIWAQYGQQGRKRIEAEYEIDTLNKKLEAIFLALLDEQAD